ncbi:patatin-like phospholipase family protein [Alkalithermobacter paradoxus]|uniref:Patatin-like phospholipase n=1 Tax=Alkalithermobacter paradoxus TaxID=29349 RepID=A0A1V4I7J6_9FIRM|nr:patatin-like phospholipase [[Clostridium] thermoalcaliphilum]
MLGLCLPGGGAKGAFQAGVIYGLYKRGVRFDIVCGTSIGAINSYFVYRGCIEKLKETWENVDEESFKNTICTENVIENSNLMNILRNLTGKDEAIKSVYVNYIDVIDKNIREVIVDITKLDCEKALDSIKYSSLLPYRTGKSKVMNDIVREFDFKRLSEEFKYDLQNGIYDGFSLDGGLINNTLLSPFIDNKVEKLIIIPLRNNYEASEHILDSYNKEDIIIISPESNLEPRDTLRFEKEFCINLFHEGYKLSENIKL